MAGIDNSIIAELLFKLSPYNQRYRVYNVLEELIAYGEKEIQQILIFHDNQFACKQEFTEYAPEKEGEEALEVDLYPHTQNRFFGSHNEKEGNRTWWPGRANRYTRASYEKVLRDQLLWYMDHKYDPDKSDASERVVQGCRDENAVFDVIRDVCRCFEVPPLEVEILRTKGENREEWINEMFTLARNKAKKKELSQKFIYNSKKTIKPVYMASYTWNGEVETLFDVEGEVFVEPPSVCRSWELPDNWSLVERISGSLLFSDGSRLPLPYTEILGSDKPGQGEFIEGENLEIITMDQTFDMKKVLARPRYDEEYQEILGQLAEMGYVDHRPVMHLDHLDIRQSAGDAAQMKIRLMVDRSDYISHQILRQAMDTTLDLQQSFVRTLRGLRGSAEEKLRGLSWTRFGAGCWPIVIDEEARPHVIVSLRNPKKVSELGSMLSYGSSGSIQYDDGSLAAGMAREIREELGLEASLKDLRIISMGVDTARYLIQVSYLWDSGLSLEDVRQARKDGTLSGGEQAIFFLPLEKIICERFLRESAFEPGAAFSLMRILQKMENNHA